MRTILFYCCLAAIAFGQSIEYGSYLGGAEKDFVCCVAPTSAGGIYLAGVTRSDDFPSTNVEGLLRGQVSTNNSDELMAGAYDDIFVAKVGPDGSPLYITRFGGSDKEGVSCLHVEDDGTVYVGGATVSDDFPTIGTTTNVVGPGNYILAVQPNGDVKFSVNIGGHGVFQIQDLAVDEQTNIVVLLQTSLQTLPVTNSMSSSAGGSLNAYIGKIQITENDRALEAGWYYGGNGRDSPQSLYILNNGRIAIAGTTDSDDLAITNGLQNAFGGGVDGFFAVFDDNGKHIIGSYFGGLGRDALHEVLSLENELILVGEASSTNNITNSLSAFAAFVDSSTGSNRVTALVPGVDLVSAGVYSNDHIYLFTESLSSNISSQAVGCHLVEAVGGNVVYTGTVSSVDRVKGGAFSGTNRIWVAGSTDTDQGIPTTANSFQEVQPSGSNTFGSHLSGWYRRLSR